MFRNYSRKSPRAGRKAGDHQSHSFERSLRLRQRLLARHADRSEWPHHPADLGHRQHRRRTARPFTSATSAPRLRRTFDNITGLLASEGATWHDIVRTTCYLRDIERDYEAFNEERTAFYQEQGLDPLPASTGIQAILCRPDLLVEIEAIAMFRRESPTE